MPELRRFYRRLTALFRVNRSDSELSREIGSHLQLLEDEYRARGFSPEEARYAAKRAFGGVEQTKEAQRDARTFQWLAGWPMDVKLGVRMLAKSPGLTIIAVIALAVAIGAGVAYLEFVNDYFRPRLAFAGGDRIVGLLNYDLGKGDVEGRSLHEFGIWKGRLLSIEEIGAARQIDSGIVTEDGRLEPVRGVELSASAFRLIPTAPLYGRPLIEDDAKASAANVVVIGEDLWRVRFNADPNIVGRTLRFADTMHTIVGVMPKSFGFPRNSNLWVPFRLDPVAFKQGEGPVVRIFGRLAPGFDEAKAQAELESLPAVEGRKAIVKPYVESLWFNGDSMWQVVVLYSFNIFFLALLGICAANVATLVFARTATREGEITVRTALGASRGRIVAQLVAEAGVLTTLAAVLGLGGAAFALHRVRAVWESAQGRPMPFWWNEQLGNETIAYAVLLVVLASLLIGAVPALKATGRGMHERLKQAGSTGASMRFGKIWTGVVIVQVAVTVVFLLTLVSLGWELYEQHRQIAEMSFPGNEYMSGRLALEDGVSPQRQSAVLAELYRRLQADPAVINVAYAMHLPGHGIGFRPVLPNRSDAEPPTVTAARVGRNYFDTFRQPLIAGRLFAANEIESESNVAVVDESFVRLILNGRNAVGQMLRDGNSDSWFQIVGVVRDVSSKANKTAGDAMIYLPVAAAGEYSMRVVLHTRSSDAATRLRAGAAATDPQLRLTDVMTIEGLATAEAQTLSFFISGLGIVAGVALMLSTAGIYALISFTLARRTREIGIRTALGAAPLRIVASILSRAFVQVTCGVLLGCIPGAAIIKRGTEGSSGLASWTTAAATIAVAVFVIAVAVLSAIAPVRRALKIHPAKALRMT